LVEADELYRKPLIDELSGLDRSWSFINDKPGGNSDQKQIRAGLQIKLALLSLTEDYRRAQKIADGLVDLAKPSPELSKFVSDQLEMLLVSTPKTALRVIARSALQSLAGNSPTRPAGEQSIDLPPVFIVAASESQQTQGEELARVLKEKGINVQGVDVIAAAKDSKLKPPLNLEIRYSKLGNEDSFLAGLAETVKKFTGEEPKLVVLSADRDSPTYEVWLSHR
jgi:hypothetical protein